MFVEKPPMLSGDVNRDMAATRDYLFRLARALEPVSDGTAEVAGYNAAGQQIERAAGSGGGATKDDIEAVKKNAGELRDLIIKSAENMQTQIAAGDQAVRNYADSKTAEYNSLYVAKSEYGTFTETINNRIEATARGVVESYDYSSAIQSMQDSIGLIQAYFTNITGEIRRGIVQDPTTGDYVTGIAIAQNLRFSGECGADDPNNPGDGYTYYYLTSGQTFGLYTSTGWQFWIDGYKKGWFNSEDGMLHVAIIFAEDSIVHGGYWETRVNQVSGFWMFELNYIGG